MSSSSVANPSGTTDLSALQPLLETALDAVVVMDAAGLVLDWSGSAQKTFGWTRGEAIGRPVADLIIPAPLRPAHRAGLERLVETGEARILDRRLELTGVRRDGGEIPVELTVTKWRDCAGGTVFLGFLRDLSQAREAAEALRASEERLRVTQEVAQVGIAETDREGRFLRVNPAFCAISGFNRAEIIGKDLADYTHPDDRAADGAAYQRQIAGEPAPYQVEKRILRKDGEYIWANVSASAAFDEKGRFLYGIRVVQDINEHKLGEARQRLLVDELNHRVKNILALVGVLAAQTAQASPDAETFNAVFQERLAALAKSHDLLIRTDWRGADLREVLTHELEPYAAREAGSHAMLLDGPAVSLDARAAVGLSLIAHELATNAVKYGALSAPGGAVELAWRWIEDVEPARLRITWTETGGPRVAEPSRRGFGSKLIERLAAGDLGGGVEFDYAPDGLRVALTIRPQEAAA